MQLYNQVCSSQLADAVRIGLVVAHLGDDRERDHQQLNASRIDPWKAMRIEVKEVVIVHCGLVCSSRVKTLGDNP